MNEINRESMIVTKPRLCNVISTMGIFALGYQQFANSKSVTLAEKDKKLLPFEWAYFDDGISLKYHRKPIE